LYAVWLLEQLSGGRWRFTETHLDSCMHYDFAAEPADEAALAEKCVVLQTNPNSGFVQSLVAQRRMPATHYILRGRLLWEKPKGHASKRCLASASELVRITGIGNNNLEGMRPFLTIDQETRKKE
jgi:arylamine N-acetyltransferase